MCCREGLDKPPGVRKNNKERNRIHQKPTKQPSKPVASTKSVTSKSSKFPNNLRKLKSLGGIDTIDLSSTNDHASHKRRDPLENLNQLHQNIVRNPSVPTLSRKQADKRKKLSTEPVSYLGTPSTSDQFSGFLSGWTADTPFSSFNLESSRVDKASVGADAFDDTFSNASVDEFFTAHGLSPQSPRAHIGRDNRPEEIGIPLGPAMHLPPSSLEPTSQSMTSMTQQPLMQIFSEAEAGCQDKRVDYSRSPSPLPKRQKPNIFEPLNRPGLEIDETHQHEPVLQTATDTGQLKDMEGIDPDLFAQFRDLVEFED